MNQFLKEYFHRTSLHGFNYLSQKKRTWVEKIFWAIALIISIVLTAIMIYELLQSYFNNPIVMYNDNSENSTSYFYFPSITFCPPLIFNTHKRKTIDYKAITNALTNNEITLDNLTMNQ
jgi:cytoskeletal protein RodZ